MLSSQRMIANRYLLTDQLGSGSYAETWLAQDFTLHRNVAIKILRPEHTSDPYELDRFRNEIRVAASISHPNVVAIYDAHVGGDLAFLVMEWIEGTTLKQEIQSQRRMELQRALSVIQGLLGGLGEAHVAGIVHRDVKPQNVLVTGSGEVRLTDFGIAYDLSDDEVETETTVGSAAYMAPEQAQGHPVSPSTDVYASGVILYEMLTGRLPFTGDDPKTVMEQHVNLPVTRPKRFNPNIPIWLESIILRALAKDPRDRFVTADQMQAEIRQASQSAANRPSAPVMRHFDTSRIPRYAWVAATIALMFVMIAGSTAIAIRDFTSGSPVAGTSEQEDAIEDDDPNPLRTEQGNDDEPELESLPDPVDDPTVDSNENEELIARENDESGVEEARAVEESAEAETVVNEGQPEAVEEEDEQPDGSAESADAEAEQSVVDPDSTDGDTGDEMQNDPEGDPPAQAQQVSTEGNSQEQEEDENVGESQSAPGNSGNGQGNGNGNGNSGNGNGNQGSNNGNGNSGNSGNGNGNNGNGNANGQS